MGNDSSKLFESDDKNIFESIREGRIIHTALYKGISAAAENFDITKAQVNEIVLKAIKGHQNMITIHQNSIKKLNKRLDEKDPNMGRTLGGCYFCGESGHVARECSCYKCGESGHLAKDCSFVGDDEGVGEAGGPTWVQKEMVSGIGPSGCRKCGQVGHKSRNCDQVGVGVGGACVCYYCGETGHVAYECSEGCYECRETGHTAKDCPEVCCFLCGQGGHWATDCRGPSLWKPSDDKGDGDGDGDGDKDDGDGDGDKDDGDGDDDDDEKVCCCVCRGEHRTKDCSGVGCYKCSKVGHLGRDCGQVWGGGGGDGVCYYCGLRGYMAVCSLCGETGHLGKDCW